jgi:hypothetical protein
MLYIYNKKTLQFTKVNLVGFVIITLGLLGFIILTSTSHIPVKKLSESEIKVIITERNKFSEDKLVNMIKEMNFEFPYIVYAQALLESNRFTSKIFRENNNLFGMKKSSYRVTRHQGVQNNYAYYNDWIDSVNDYGFYYSTYLSKIKTEDDYFSYLSQYYAEDVDYIAKLKNMISKEELKSKFN